MQNNIENIKKIFGTSLGCTLFWFLLFYKDQRLFALVIGIINALLAILSGFGYWWLLKQSSVRNHGVVVDENGVEHISLRQKKDHTNLS